MKFIVKFFPEITIKSKPVRKQFVQQLRDNLRKLMSALADDIHIRKDWDKLVIYTQSNDPHLRQRMIDSIANTPGIAYFLDVAEFPLADMHDVFEKTLLLWRERLAGKTFVVRCKRSGQHDFNSNEVERYVGGGLLQHSEAAGVKLKGADITVNLEIRDQSLFVINERFAGLGGYPIGALDSVVSLISGGFDSTVSTYLTMKRGMRTHFCFFNLGGRDHEVGVKEVALYLWMKYSSTHRVRFVSVPFEGVVSEILKNVDDSQMGVVLKRMMMRAGSAITERLGAGAMVTGESVAQVSSQTLQNLSLIDQVADSLVLRPLVTTDKDEIIRLSKQIGTEEFAAAMPEYCGVISVKPTTRARKERIEAEEAKFDFAVLEKAIADAVSTNIEDVAHHKQTGQEVEELSVPVQNGVIIDVRHPTEEERKPLSVPNAQVEKIPFYELHKRFSELDRSKVYLLYCEKGVMSKLHAAHLMDQGYSNVKVYRP